MYIGTDEEIIEYEHQTMKTTAKSTELFLLIRIKKKIRRNVCRVKRSVHPNYYQKY